MDVGAPTRAAQRLFLPAHKKQFELTVLLYPAILSTAPFIVYNRTKDPLHQSSGSTSQGGFSKGTSYGATSRNAFMNPHVFGLEKAYTFSAYGQNFPSEDMSQGLCRFRFTTESKREYVPLSKRLYKSAALCYADKHCYCLTPELDPDLLGATRNLTLHFSIRFLFQYDVITNHFDTAEFEVPVQVRQPIPKVSAQYVRSRYFYLTLFHHGKCLLGHFPREGAHDIIVIGEFYRHSSCQTFPVVKQREVKIPRP